MDDKKIHKDSDLERVIRETPAAYVVQKQGTHTVEEYYALPDEPRVELIDGVFYDMAAPTSIHQIMVLEIGKVLDAYIEGKQGKCMVLLSPIDVQLDEDNKTMVQPDLLVLSDKSKLRKWGIYGAPDFVIEIISPGSRKKDMLIKANKYMEAGVSEYWIVDPQKKWVQVYDFRGNEYPGTYTFADKIPVGIYEGDCQVDFAVIQRKIDTLELA